MSSQNLNDDFNTPIALSILFEIAKQVNIERLLLIKSSDLKLKKKVYLNYLY